MSKIIRSIITFMFRLSDFEFLGFEYVKILKLYNKIWKIPVLKGIGQSHVELHEDYLFNHYKEIIKNTDTFIDVGANLGQTIIKIKSINSEINYIAFEPSITCVNYINLLVTHNKIKNLELFPIGLYKSNDVLSFYINSGHSQGNSIIEGIRRDIAKNKINIPVFRLDHFQDKVSLKGKVVVKIDVEGAEYFVLEGMTELIRIHRPILVMEFLRIPSQNTDYVDQTARTKRLTNQEQCETFFNSYQYSKYCLTPDGKFDLVATIGFNEDESRTNYIVIPNELNIDLYKI